MQIGINTVYNTTFNSSFSRPLLRPLTGVEAADKIMQVSSLFAEAKAEILAGTKHLKYYESSDGRKFFGIHKNDQAHVDFACIRSHLVQKLRLPAYSPLIQIIGDSGKFSAAGTAFAKSYIAKQLADNDNALILWGYTASGGVDHQTEDANGLLNEWIDQDPVRGERVLANIVNFGPKDSSDPEKVADTQTVINLYKAKVAAYAKNYYIVYGKAQFGDDIDSSDQITDHAICFEGGAQSWRQIVNILSHGGKVSGLFNLRGEKNPATFVKKFQDYCTFFSAGEFIDLLLNAMKAKQSRGEIVEKQFIEGFKEEYLKTRYIFNPDRHDAATKLPLFEAAWKKFIDEKLWEKLDCCQFQKFVPSCL